MKLDSVFFVVQADAAEAFDALEEILDLVALGVKMGT